MKDLSRKKGLQLTTRELSESTWKDFENLFERNGGVCGGCWCTFYHTPRSIPWSWKPSNRETHRELLGRGRAHGVIVMTGDVPVGWCQFGPREELSRMDGRRGYSAPQEDFWRITCFFVERTYRRKGVARTALQAALRSMERANVGLVEAYPVDPKKRTASANLLWSGTPALFASCGFRKAGRLGRRSWVMRKRLRPVVHATRSRGTSPAKVLSSRPPATVKGTEI